MNPILPVFSFGLALWFNRRRGPGPQWASLRFMCGRWRIDRVKTAQDWRPARGDCDIFALGDGETLTRRNRVTAPDAKGRARPVFDPVLRMFHEAGALRADYAIDGEVIRFDEAAILGSREVVFTAAPRANGPVFRLRYQRVDNNTLASELALAAPGGAFHPVLSEALKRRR